MAYANAYEKLYNNMKNTFTVVKNNNEYTLGQYMSLKAEGATNDSQAYSGKTESKGTVSAFFSYVNEKMSKKENSRTQSTRMPFRSIAASCLCTLVIIALVCSVGMFKISKSDSTAPAIAESVEETETLNGNK